LGAVTFNFYGVWDKINLNIVRKIAINSIKQYKKDSNIKRPISKIMLDCLLDPSFMLALLSVDEN